MKKLLIGLLLPLLLLCGCSAAANTIGDKKANVYYLSKKYKSAPLYDADTNQVIAEIYKDFALPIEGLEGDKVFITISIDESGKDNYTPKKLYIPLKYLAKGYKEPFAVIEIISIDTIKIKENACLYDAHKESEVCIAKFKDEFGPIHFIQKTNRGYEFVFGNNLVYVKDGDANLIKHQEWLSL